MRGQTLLPLPPREAIQEGSAGPSLATRSTRAVPRARRRMLQIQVGVRAGRPLCRPGQARPGQAVPWELRPRGRTLGWAGLRQSDRGRRAAPCLEQGPRPRAGERGPPPASDPPHPHHPPLGAPPSLPPLLPSRTRRLEGGPDAMTKSVI